MADYSELGIPSPEWARYFQDNPNDVFAKGFVPDIASRPIEYLEELQRTANRNQIAAAQAKCKQMGWTESVVKTDLEVKSRSTGSIPIRIYKGRDRTATPGSPLPVYVYYHGGGYMFGTLDGEDANCSYLANELPILVVNVCYRHTPQYKFPTQREDALDSYLWTVANISRYGGDPHRIVIGGISAGGGLAAWLTLTESQRPSVDPGVGQIRGQVLGIPWLIQPSIFPTHLLKSPEVGSYHQCQSAPVLPRSKMEFFERSLAEPNPTDDFVDLNEDGLQSLKALPMTAVLVAGMDVLRDEALLYSQNLKRVK
ncbi:hypothetical protein H2204_000176 [Knufia peltigerae]|uniref:Alpha/beta hydrolase fold-3 domain-containing protein n=1 Tax=Knufia peltigerae TaxID=1002370 RepID=A0AA38YFD8_9EURO|nr:hypothetical protein H2204_000176 [Knufia peltigerae]